MTAGREVSIEARGLTSTAIDGFSPNKFLRVYLLRVAACGDMDELQRRHFGAAFERNGLDEGYM